MLVSTAVIGPGLRHLRQYRPTLVRCVPGTWYQVVGGFFLLTRVPGLRRNIQPIKRRAQKYCPILSREQIRILFSTLDYVIYLGQGNNQGHLTPNTNLLS